VATWLWPVTTAGWDLETPWEVDTVRGACVILRRPALDQVRLPDEDYFMYMEEVDLCHKLHQGGWRIYWVPQAVVVHYGGESTRQTPEAMFLRLYQGKALYFRKHHGWLAAQICKLIRLAAALARLALSRLAWLKRPPHRPAAPGPFDRLRAGSGWPLPAAGADPTRNASDVEPESDAPGDLN
jgi:GT2 family glycosyltransferase